jgi:hypothetical protein
MTDAAHDDSVPRWKTTRDAAYRNTCVIPARHEFTGDPSHLPFGSYVPVNQAARNWQSGFITSPERPKWISTKRTVVNNQVVEVGTAFLSDRWPESDWRPVNEAADQVVAYHARQRDKARSRCGRGSTMARYRLLQPHFLGDRHFLAGALVDWDGPPSRHMEAVDEAAKQVMAEFEMRQSTGDRLPRRKTRNRSYLKSALHAPSTAPGEKPLWSGFVAVAKDEQERPAPPPKLPR